MIEQCGLRDTIDLSVEHDHLIIVAVRRPRRGWKEAFREAGAADKDQVLFDRVEPERCGKELESLDWRLKSCPRQDGLKTHRRIRGNRVLD